MINIDKNLFLQHSNNFIAITSGAGNTGKTWIATTLAHALNQLKHEILLFDADNGLLNIDFQLGLGQKANLNLALNDEKTLNQITLHLNKKKFDIIAATAGSAELEGVSQGRLQMLREDLIIMAKEYYKVIIDLPSSEKIIQNLLPAQADLFLVCTNDPSNLVTTYNFLQKAVDKYAYKNIQIIVNSANSYEDGLQTYNTLRRACEQYIKSTPKLLGVIRRDTRVRDAIRNQVLFLSRYPNSEAAEDILNIARKIISEREKDAA